MDIASFHDDPLDDDRADNTQDCFTVLIVRAQRKICFKLIIRLTVSEALTPTITLLHSTFISLLLADIRTEQQRIIAIASIIF